MIRILFLIVFFAFQIGNCQEFSEPIHQPKGKTVFKASEIEVIPEYPGGIDKFYKFVYKNYKMPDTKGLSAKVFVTFVVEKNGKLTDIKVIRDIGYGSGKEAIRVLKKSKHWLPGYKNGKKVRVLYVLPINVTSCI